MLYGGGMGCFTRLFSWNRSKIVFKKILSLTVGALKITFVARWKGLSLSGILLRLLQCQKGMTSLSPAPVIIQTCP